ncbi:hypothetical protein ANN_09667 [Periplaneta americana]|uniref:Uncharacterized protein n=1 Tax=Periplaneta americana TaxID=6978 RepID=A0ABQ8TQJ7_PERAM|nr:hypothetical protein ANN_09667 [Periplaneta americana]
MPKLLLILQEPKGISTRAAERILLTVNLVVKWTPSGKMINEIWIEFLLNIFFPNSATCSLLLLDLYGIQCDENTIKQMIEERDYGLGQLMVNYDIRKTGIMFPIRGENDMCEEMAKMSQYPQALKMMQEYNITASCPMQKACGVMYVIVSSSVTTLMNAFPPFSFQTRMCVPENGRLNVTSLKDKFNFLSGQYTGKITFTCDCGKSCFDFDVKFKRGK